MKLIFAHCKLTACFASIVSFMPITLLSFRQETKSTKSPLLFIVNKLTHMWLTSAFSSLVIVISWFRPQSFLRRLAIKIINLGHFLEGELWYETHSLIWSYGFVMWGTGKKGITLAGGQAESNFENKFCLWLTSSSRYALITLLLLAGSERNEGQI